MRRQQKGTRAPHVLAWIIASEGKDRHEMQKTTKKRGSRHGKSMVPPIPPGNPGHRTKGKIPIQFMATPRQRDMLNAMSEQTGLTKRVILEMALDQVEPVLKEIARIRRKAARGGVSS